MAQYAQPTIEKLGANNYENWARDMKHVLIDRNCWEIVSGIETKPKIEGPELKDFLSRSRIALSVIYLNIANDFKAIIQDSDSAKDAWGKIKNHFEPDNRARHMLLFTEFINTRIGEHEDIELFSNRLKTMFLKFKDLRDPLPGTYLNFQFLRYLPNCFDSVIQNVMRWPEQDFKYEKIVQEIVAEELRLKVREMDLLQGATAQYSQPQGGSGYRQRQDRPNDCNFRAKRHDYRHRESSPQRDRTPSPRRRTFSKNRRGWYGNGAQSYARQSGQYYRNEGSQTPRQNFKPRSKSKQRADTRTGQAFFSVANLTTSKLRRSGWIFDSASSHHFVNNKSILRNFYGINEKMSVAVQGTTFPIKGKGDVELNFNGQVITLLDALYVPNLKRNLISGSRIDQAGGSFIGKDGEVRVINKYNETLFKASLENGIYYTYPKVICQEPVENFEASLSMMEVWHRRLAHISPELIENTGKSDGVRGLPKLKRNGFFCEECQVNKQKRVSFKPIYEGRSKKPLELLVMDVWEAPVKGRRGERYLLTIIDEFSRKTSVYPMKSKAESFQIFRQHVERVENFLEKRVKSARSDNGKEFDNACFERFCGEKGIKSEFTNTYTPEQNGIAERYNQTLASGVRTILDETGIDQSFWPDAALYFTYTWNRVCHKNKDKTPFEMFCGNRPSVRHLKPFGTTAYVGIPTQKRGKFDRRAKKGLLIGYAFRTKGYRIWIPEESKVVETINVTFKENPGEIYNLRRGAVLGQGTEECNGGHGNSENEISPKPTHVLVPRYEPPITTVESGTSTDDRECSESETEDTGVPTTSDESGNQSRKVSWVRAPVERSDGSRTDIYYYEEGKTQRLRSYNDVQSYCKENRIEYNPDLFNFSGKNKFAGRVDQFDAAANTSEIENETL